MKVEKALNFWVEDMKRKRIPVDGRMLGQKALRPYEDFQKKDRTEQLTKPFIASTEWLHRLRIGLILKTLHS